MAPRLSHDERIAKMTYGAIYPLYGDKVDKKGSTFETFFAEAKLHPNAKKITGVICGYRVENIENPQTQKARYLDKVVDELARGMKVESLLRA